MSLHSNGRNQGFSYEKIPHSCFIDLDELFLGRMGAGPHLCGASGGTLSFRLSLSSRLLPEILLSALLLPLRVLSETLYLRRASFRTFWILPALPLLLSRILRRRRERLLQHPGIQHFGGIGLLRPTRLGTVKDIAHRSTQYGRMRTLDTPRPETRVIQIETTLFQGL